MLERQLRENLERVLEKIERACQRAGRKREEIKILGASKKQDPEKIRLLYQLGIKIFGENYVQEAEKKQVFLSDLDIEWHFIGRLQRNKVKKALQIFHVIETLDRIELASEIQKKLKEKEKKFPLFIEVNIGKEPTKAGVKPEELFNFAESLLEYKGLEIRGLMCLPPYFEEVERVRPYFRKMRELFEKIAPLFGETFKELSMGTSSDFEIAIEEGATIIRLGTILFGQRM
ncbi:MAG: YggS family pyridoxal phosphate-dependent enzyme [Caldimicrobium sp.]